MTAAKRHASTNDPFNLARFVVAQDRVFDQALAELRAGAKRGHWMWFVFPQLDGLGRSSMTERYAIRNADEVRTYLAHDVLRPRLQACSEALLEAGRDHPTLTAHAALGCPDDQKLQSSMTLLARTYGENKPYRSVLDRFYTGTFDERSATRLRETRI